MSDIIYHAAPNLGPVFLGIALLIICLSLFPAKSKSNRYRERMTDLYIVGVVRKLAKEDDINLAEEEKLFIRNINEIRRYNLPLDKSIEHDIKDRVAEDINSKEERRK